jgi:DNA repair exonuclease SbcCD ATPase subunit
MLITLDHVHIHLVGAIGENQHIDMPQNQIVAIIGENKDDGGSNGSSKSTFTYASPLSLFGSKAVGKTNKELKNDKIKGTPRVICKYTVDGKGLIVDRTIGGELKVTYDGNGIKGSTDEVQSRLEKIIGMTMEQFLQFSYKGQKTTEHFLKMKDSEKKEFLSSFFDTSKLDKMKELSDIRLSVLKKDKEKNDGAAEQLLTFWKTSEERYNALKLNHDEFIKQKTTDLDTNTLLLESSKKQLQGLNSIPESFILSADEEYDKKSNEYIELEKSTEIQKSAYAQSYMDIMGLIGIKKIPRKNEQAESIKEEINSLIVKKTNVAVPQDLMNDLTQCVGFVKDQRDGLKLINLKQLELSNVIQKIAMNEGIIKDIDAKPCPTCNRAFDDSHKEQQKSGFIANGKEFQAISDSKRNELNLLQEQFSEETVNLLLERQAELNSEIKGYKDKHIGEIESKMALLKVEMDSILLKDKMEKDAEISKLEAELQSISAAKASIESTLSMAKSQFTIIKNKVLSAHKEALAKCNTTVNSLSDKVNSLEQEIKSATLYLEREEKALNENLSKYEQAKALKAKLTEEVTVQEHVSFILSKNGFTGYLFDTILDDLNSEINTNLKLVPVTSKFVLNFTPDKTAKTSGEVSKAITYELTKGGVESSLGKTSGAEELVILLSVDEAVETVLSKRLGINIGWKILDEQLFWVDGNSKEYVFEFYRQKSKDKTYYIIDHASEFNAAIDCVIKVIKENDISRIVHD